ncbi:unnamed protein product, partial [Symbiodinium pilosum]
MDAPSDLDTREGLISLMQTLQVPAPLQDALINSGIACIADFAYAYSDASDLNSFIAKQPDALWEGMQITDPEHSPAVARRALDRPARPLHRHPQASTPAASNVWAEHAPPRLDSEAVQRMQASFRANCPGEHLDADGMPSIRLLSLVHQWFTPKGVIKWVTALAEAMRNLQLKHGNKTLCIRFNKTECNDRKCKFAHLCAIRLANGTERSSTPQPRSRTPMPARKSAQQPRLFLDLFSGQRAPLTQAMERLGCDCFHPFDIAFAPGLDILNDSHYRLLLRVACSGIVGAGWSAPPCKEYSRLKLRRPGPKALRTPEFMQGVPGLSEEELLRVLQSTEIHARSRRVTRCIREAAGEAGLEQPASSMAWLEEDNVTLLRELCAHCSHVAACEHGMDYYKSWAFCASFASIRTLACTRHPP